MPQRAWNAKRERQYEHIKEALEHSGRSEELAEEIAARTVLTRSEPELARPSNPPAHRSRTFPQRAPRRPAVSPGTWRAHTRPALRGSPPPWREGAFQNVQGPVACRPWTAEPARSCESDDPDGPHPLGWRSTTR